MDTFTQALSNSISTATITEDLVSNFPEFTEAQLQEIVATSNTTSEVMKKCMVKQGAGITTLDPMLAGQLMGMVKEKNKLKHQVRLNEIETLIDGFLNQIGTIKDKMRERNQLVTSYNYKVEAAMDKAIKDAGLKKKYVTAGGSVSQTAVGKDIKAGKATAEDLQAKFHKYRELYKEYFNAIQKPDTSIYADAEVLSQTMNSKLKALYKERDYLIEGEYR